MELTNKAVQQFESEQELFGTRTALANVLWLVASDLLRGIGVRRIQTTYARNKATMGTRTKGKAGK